MFNDKQILVISVNYMNVQILFYYLVCTFNFKTTNIRQHIKLLVALKHLLLEILVLVYIFLSFRALKATIAISCTRISQNISEKLALKFIFELLIEKNINQENN